ncbi:MAG TPA: DoxX family protein [Terracidiphilus sp.]|nr:DoxX family protein [Terracidiphilus sp.]
MSVSGGGSRGTLGLLFLRVMVGWVFLSEGIDKLLYPAALGAGRFHAIGIPFPRFSAPFVGVVEIVCGALLIAGLAMTFAIAALLIDICVAIATTKVPFLMKHGFWAAMHESRTDFCMLMGLIAIALLGVGGFSLAGGRGR